MIPPVEREEEKISTPPVLREELKFAPAKIASFQYFSVAVFVFLVSGFWELQVRNPAHYQEQAEQNSIKSIPVLAPRGKILDRDGRIIVDNHDSYSLILTRENLKMEHLPAIAEGLNLEYDQLAARVRRFRSEPKYVPIIIKEELTPAELAFVESHRDAGTFPEMELIHGQRRLYPKDGLAAHVIGYVGEISESELNTPEFAKYDQGALIGKDGIERQYNDTLMGVDGQRRVTVDNLGNEHEVLEDKPAIPGKDLQLTIDLDLQVVAELAMQDKRGSVVVLNPRNGEVLAMVSHPAYDPNLFAARIRAEDWRNLVNNPDHPLFNRAIQDQLPPGSTFKPIMGLAGLESGSITPDYHVTCAGGASFYGHFHACLAHHGPLDLHQAIVHSCDTYFYTLANRLGVDTIAKYAEAAGIGHRTGIDLPHEAEGIMPSTAWKRRVFREKWYAGEVISVGVGQGAVAVTPLQLARAIGGLAMGGIWYRPHLVTGATPFSVKSDLNPENVQTIVSAMYGVVNEGGTGGNARIPGQTVCGKTGTAQAVSAELAKRVHNQSTKDHAWFVGFAPREAPEVVAVALFENAGQHGSTAAPIVRDVIKAYFDKKLRLQQARPTIALLMPSLFQPPAHK
ncbi:MAG TPA: penicillin-binding protein 2 [Bryobacteraceae bacterium]|nr:penicillin-binding protein 2 [Bryobacteraceae bacterium]